MGQRYHDDYETGGSFSFNGYGELIHSGIRCGDEHATNENVTQKWIWKPPVAPVNYKSKR